MSIHDFYIQACVTVSDINEHLPVLRSYASKVNHITECGVRSVVSSYAFADGLLRKNPNKLIQVDLDSNENVKNFAQKCKEEGINVIFYQQSDLECPLEQTDLLFIDTWHVYGHLKRELARWHTMVNKYIILHDTTIDADLGETVRIGWNAKSQSESTGIPVEEITNGLWPAVLEFLELHPEWRIEIRYENNNGLTVLSRD
jgi:hypothetical protein